MTALVLAVGNTDKWWFGEWVGREVNQDKIIAATREHVLLTVAAVVIGLVIAIPASILVVRFPLLKGAVLGVAGALYTIPSLALYGFLVPYLGLSYRTALVPLVLYTLLILVRNTVTGLEQVPAEVRDAADGMGMSRRQRRWRVEMPLALPSIMAGVRIATVSTIGMLTIAALVGLGGLGRLILSGLNLPMRTAVTVGVGLSVGLAVLADVGLALLGRWLTPWTRRPRRRRGESEATDPVAGIAMLPDGAVTA
ncbi:MAG TPA: ABC transporter permease [Iamia sp.]|nr:ABC transporter permease [Iamia sp.]